MYYNEYNKLFQRNASKTTISNTKTIIENNIEYCEVNKQQPNKKIICPCGESYIYKNKIIYWILTIMILIN
jgi:hypothetical protein